MRVVVVRTISSFDRLPPTVPLSMRLLYPSSHEIHRLSDSQLSVKIARHSACSVCKSCTGLHPLPGIIVVSDDDIEASSSLLRDLTQYGSDDDDGSTYLQSCACGHSAAEHNAELSDLDRDEFIRRGLVGIRLDELLQVSPCVSKSHRPHLSSVDRYA